MPHPISALTSRIRSWNKGFLHAYSVAARERYLRDAFDEDGRSRRTTVTDPRKFRRWWQRL